MNTAHSRSFFILGLFLFIPLLTFGGNGAEVSAQQVKQVIGKKLKITHVDFKGLDLPAATHFEIEFTDDTNCLVFMNNKAYKAIWKFNSRTKMIDVKNNFSGSIKSFTLTKRGEIRQRVNEEEMYQLIASVLK